MRKTLNIYLEKEDRKKIDKIKVKYQLSLTTIVDILLFATTKTLLHYEKDNTTINELQENYLYKKGAKTSIKMPHINEELKVWKNDKSKSKYATNVLKIYIYHDISKYVNDPKLIEEYWNYCNREMTKRKDEFWNYNQFIRSQRRMLRENKDYFRKVLQNE